MKPSITRRGVLAAGFIAALARPAIAKVEPPDGMPKDQWLFESYVFMHYWTWRRVESNAIRRAELPGDRARDLREAMRDQTAFRNWQLTVVTVGLDNEGHAYIALMSRGKTTPRVLFTNIASTADDRLDQRLPLGSPIYKTATGLVRGDAVIASGEFFDDPDDGYRELGRQLNQPMEDRMRFPQFCVRWTDLRRR